MKPIFASALIALVADCTDSAGPDVPALENAPSAEMQSDLSDCQDLARTHQSAG